MAAQYGVDPIHLGPIIIINLTIGLASAFRYRAIYHIGDNRSIGLRLSLPACLHRSDGLDRGAYSFDL
ncbi:hypothetical protein [Paenibacillus tianmuensis]|uniref:hypothetical protein n=1 Tax=Paenibacillus tianmuensis TaxID=624147 RepID=UPI001FE02D3E|nr:hypothetical protein [Paenibacillus tianmuensis]